MNKKFLWMLVCSLMVLPLVLVACGEAAPTTPPTPTTPTTSTTPATSTPTTPTSTPTEAPVQEPVVRDETPEYGGTISLVLSGDIRTWAAIESC